LQGGINNNNATNNNKNNYKRNVDNVAHGAYVSWHDFPRRRAGGEVKARRHGKVNTTLSKYIPWGRQLAGNLL